MSAKPNPKRERGRPATGITRKKVSVSVPIALLALAQKQARKSDESLSQYVSRAIQNLTLAP
jgi:predicted HicB family RNase H-like nuclease